MPAQAAVGASRIGYENYHEAQLLMAVLINDDHVSCVHSVRLHTFPKKKLHAEQKNY